MRVISILAFLPFFATAQDLSRLQVVSEFFQTVSAASPVDVKECAQDPQPCVQYSSERTSSYDKASVLDFVKSCRGNFSQACVKYVAERTSAFDKATLVEAGAACRGNVTESCVKYASERSSSYDKATVLEYAKACQAYFESM